MDGLPVGGNRRKGLCFRKANFARRETILQLSTTNGTSPRTSQYSIVFAAIAPEKQAIVLGVLAQVATVEARKCFYSTLADNTKLQKGMAINELLHRIVGQMLRLIEQDLKRYPDDVFIEVIIDGARSAQFEQSVIDVFDEIVESWNRRTKPQP